MEDELNKLLYAERFSRFVIMLTSGERVEIDNPHLVVVGRTIMHVFAPRSDKYQVLRLNTLASLAVIEEPKSA